MGLLAVAATMAQIASAFPTAGGLYHWASLLGGRGWGWATAWFNLLGLDAVLFVGERPGLATAESLSAYLAYRPCPGHSDANRELVSNVHRQGLSIPESTARIARLVAGMRERRWSGVAPR